MAQSRKKRISPEVELSVAERVFLVKKNEDETCYCVSEQEALLVVDSIADQEQRRNEDDYTKSYRKDIEGGKKVIISTQARGYFVDGGLSTVAVIEYLPIMLGETVKCRWKLDDRSVGSQSDDEDL